MSFEACGPKLAGLLEELLWGPFLNNPPLLQAIDSVTVLDRGQTVSDDDHRFFPFRRRLAVSLVKWRTNRESVLS